MSPGVTVWRPGGCGSRVRVCRVRCGCVLYCGLDADAGGIGGPDGSPLDCDAPDSAEDGEPHSGDGSSEDGSGSDSSEDDSHSDDEDLSATNLNSPDVVSCRSDSLEAFQQVAFGSDAFCGSDSSEDGQPMDASGPATLERMLAGTVGVAASAAACGP